MTLKHWLRQSFVSEYAWKCQLLWGFNVWWTLGIFMRCFFFVDVLCCKSKSSFPARSIQTFNTTFWTPIPHALYHINFQTVFVIGGEIDKCIKRTHYFALRHIHKFARTQILTLDTPWDFNNNPGDCLSCHASVMVVLLSGLPAADGKAGTETSDSVGWCRGWN